jgi:hypothetical protein
MSESFFQGPDPEFFSYFVTFVRFVVKYFIIVHTEEETNERRSVLAETRV